MRATPTTPTPTAMLLSRSPRRLPSLPRSRGRPAGVARCVAASASLTSTSGRNGVAPAATPGLSRRRLQPHTPASVTVPRAFFGVGAPEAILVGVVALLVFGPKGLAEAVKAAGATLRAFQPTIRELASVSTELRSTLEEQIGLDEIKAELNAAVAPLPATTPVKKKKVEEEAAAEEEGASDGEGDEEEFVDPRPSLTEFAETMSGAEEIDPDIRAKRAAAAAAAWGGNVPAVLSSADAADAPSPSSPKVAVQGAGLEEALAAAAAAKATAPKSLEGLSIEELEAELARRRGS